MEASAGSTAKAAPQPDLCDVLTTVYRVGRSHTEMFLLLTYRLLAPDRPIHPDWEPWEASRVPASLLQGAPSTGLQTRLLLPSWLPSLCQWMEGHPEAACSGRSLAGLGLNPLGFLCFPVVWATHLLCQCPVAANNRILLSQVWRPEVQGQCASRACGLQGRSLPRL